MARLQIEINDCAFTSDVYLMDCIEGMKHYPDKYFDLAVVDVPYGIGESLKKRENTTSDKWKAPTKKVHNPKDWDKEPPNLEYFYELFRVSKNQIVWGANHFISRMPYDSSCWLVWDKKNGASDFADCELAWASFDKAVRKFEWLWNGFQKQRPEERIHPTQKPVALYDWIFTNYSEKGMTILDTHLGSGSSRISANKANLNFVGFEIDKEYFDKSCKRYNDFVSQVRLF
jgi:site-specific DNA-methyltransferase (adenine-specific)